MKRHYDIAVIGSGLGGLVAALLLAKEGKKVCVLEKNNQYGGNLQTFSRNKLLFDTGVHYLGGLSKGQNLHQYFSYLGIMEDLEIVQMDKDGYDWISFEDDPCSYPHAQGYENFVAQLSQYFPEERSNLEKYCAAIQDICKQFPRYQLIGEKPYNTDILGVNNKEFIESITSNTKLQSILCGSNFLYAGDATAVPLYVHALTVDSYMQSAYRCVKGGSQISKLLVRKLREYGANIFKHAEVSTLLYDDENTKMIAVQTTEGKKITADQFISNIDIHSLINMQGSQFRKPFVNRIESMRPTTSCFSVYIVLKPKTIPFFNHNIYHFRDENTVWTAATEIDEKTPNFYMLSAISSSKNPEYAESLTAITYMHYDEVKSWEDTCNTVAAKSARGKDYDVFKKDKATKLIAQLEKKIPNLKDAILEVYTSTPLSYRDYIGNYQGNMYGYIKDATQPMQTVISPRTKTSNLFLTGQSVNMHGILGVTIGAFNTCEAIIGKERIDEILLPFIKEMKSQNPC